MSSTPGWFNQVISGRGVLTTGDTSRTAPTHSQTIFTPTSGGGDCERVVIVPQATLVASVVRLFIFDGTNYNLYFERALPVQTLSAGTAITVDVLDAIIYPDLFPIPVPAGSTVVATVNDTQTALLIHGQGVGG